MKLKKGLIVVIISIFILAFSTSSYAMTLRDKLRSRTTNETSNVIENTTKNEVDNEIENKTKNEVDNKTKNEVSNKTENETKNEVKNETSNDSETENKVEDKNKSKSENTAKVKLINKDLSIFESSDELEYENLKINGNVFIASSNKVTFNNVEIDGDVMLFTSGASEILNSEINGSVYIASDNVIIRDSAIISLYSMGDNLNIEKGTEITREVKLIGNKITFNGEVGRNFLAFGGTVKIDDAGKVYGNTVIRAESKHISRIADINNLDYEEINYAKDDDNIAISYLINKGIEVAIILCITILLLCGFPKFVKVNSNSRLGEFFVEFFLGLLMFIISLVIAIGLFVTGYGFGYGLILLNLLFIFVILGKIIFIISFAIRWTCNSEKTSKVKAFFGTILVSIILAMIGLISLAGNVGIIIDSILSVILAFTGFGTIFKTIFASKKKYENKSQEYIKTNEDVKQNQVASESKIDKSIEKEELKKEIEEEVKQEIDELREERKLENDIIEENKKVENNEENVNNDENDKNAEDKKEE